MCVDSGIERISVYYVEVNNLGRERSIKRHTNAADSLNKGPLGHTDIFVLSSVRHIVKDKKTFFGSRAA
jgi:hypothetical protein